MIETHIYIETDSISSKTTEKQYGYVLECKIAGEIKTREGFGKVNGTYHNAVLTAMVEALGRFNQSCEIYIHTENKFVLNMLELNLVKWAGNEFLTSKGKPVTNQEEWMRIWNLSTKHLILTEPGSHIYSGWLQSEMKARKEK